jgi:hypothetical protein
VSRHLAAARRPERSPLHDVRQHAQADDPWRGADRLREFVFLRTSYQRADRIKPLVEPDGIEPTTSCLQSRRSPN